MNSKFMNLAIKEAIKAYNNDDIPVGCVIVCNDKVISKAYNKKNRTNNATHHAEMLAISKACKKLNTWRLNDCDIYITLEPCNMCMGAIVESRIKNVYYLLNSNYYETFNNNKLKINVNKLEDTYKYKEMMGNFFINKRK